VLQIAELARLVPSLDAAAYAASGHSDLFTETLTELAGLFTRLTDTDALSALAVALARAAALPEPALAAAAAAECDRVGAVCVARLAEAVDVLAALDDAALQARARAQS
jgi:hypothetical protein